MKNALLLLSVLVFISGCKKYPEDDVFIQWKKPEKRLDKWSPWELVRITENEVDITSVYRNDSSCVSTLWFGKLEEELNFVPICFLCEGNTVGIYDLEEKKSKLKMSSYAILNSKGEYFFLLDKITWEIRSLQKGQLILEGMYFGTKYRMEFKN